MSLISDITHVIKKDFLVSLITFVILIKLEIILPETDVRVITDELKKLSVGGITISKSGVDEKVKRLKYMLQQKQKFSYPNSVKDS